MTQEAYNAIEKEKRTKTGELNLVNMLLFEVPPELLDMSWLKELYLGSNLIGKITNLDALVNLEVLNLYGNSIASINGLNSLTNLKTLSLTDNRISES